MGNLKRHYLIAFWVTLSLSICLVTGGFLTPPMAVIDGSILESVGLIFLWPALAFGAKALEEKNKVKISHGQTTISIGENEDNEEEEEN